MKLRFFIGLISVVALLLLGCTGAARPEVHSVGQQVDSTQGEEASVSPTEVAPETAATSPSPEAEPTVVPEAAAPVVAENAVPNREPQPTPIVSTSAESARPTPTARPAPTVPASAEGPGPDAPAPPGPAPQVYSPQPLPLHPFRPASDRARVIAIDPGHGGAEVGAGGAGLAEKNVNLAIALMLQKLLEQDGMKVVLTRDGDRRAYLNHENSVPEGTSSTRQDLQARIDIANRAQADVFVSIHNNGSADPGQQGTEVWWDGKRPFAAFNAALAEDVLASLLEAIRGTGYPVANRGLKEDSNFRIFQSRAFPLFVLGPPRTGSSATRATQMPSVLGETLFLSNPAEAAQLTREAVIAAIASGYQEGLSRYFRRIDSGALAMPAGGLPSEKPNFYQLTPNPGGGDPAAPR